MLRRRSLSLRVGVLFACAGALCAACESDDSEAAAATGPLVGLLELPISHRHTDREPSGSTRIEIGPSAIRVGSEDVLTLDNAKVADADRKGNVLPKLEAALGSPRAVSLVVHGATPYATLARAMMTAQAAGVREFYFQVRKPAATTETGWLRLSDVRFTDHLDPPVFEVDEMTEWSQFTDVWDQVRAGCKEDPAGDCGYVPMVKAEGGKLDMLLRARGTGISARFRQYLPEGVEAPEPEKKKKGPAMLDGIAAPAPEEEEEDPSTEAQYTLRAEQAARPESPFASIIKPVCGDAKCAVVLDAQPIALSARVISLIGAAFPDGTPEPKLALLEPDN